MSLSDPLGDMLTRIRNGQLRRKDSVLMPASRFRGNVLNVLHREGYIRGFKKIELENHKNNFQIELKYIDGEPVIQEYLHLEEEFTQKLETFKEILTVLEYQSCRHQRGCFLTAKLETRTLVAKFCVRFFRR